MYDLSSKFNTFYKKCVVLNRDEQTKLYQKKELNIQRLKEGLEEYNIENKTSYVIADSCVQGSVAMSTVVQNEDNDFDIDVAVVFDKDVLGNKGAQATRNMVANALKRKTKQFSTEPIVKTSCVRVKYSDGYHIDFAIYRREWDETNDCWIYEHSGGTEWSLRELKGIIEWFDLENAVSNGKLRKVVRLSKMFCKSRESWKNMPSGLLQTVLCDEKLQDSYDRIDEFFYHTMQEIVSRIENETSVLSPADSGRDLTPRQIDKQRMINWKNRLKSKLEDLEVLFKEDCSQDDALQAWYGFFNHDYWSEQITNETCSLTEFKKSVVTTYTDTEEFIDDMFPVQLNYTVDILCNVSGDGWRIQPLSKMLRILGRFLPHDFEIHCSVLSTTVPYPYDVYWKVKNVGPEAQRRNMIRGQIWKKGKAITEHSNFYGNHYIECYIVKNSVCVAKKRINVPIGR